MENQSEHIIKLLEMLNSHLAVLNDVVYTGLSVLISLVLINTIINVIKSA